MRINQVSLSPYINFCKRPTKKERVGGILAQHKDNDYTGKVVVKHKSSRNAYILSYNDGQLTQSNFILNSKLRKAKRYIYDSNGKLKQIIHYNSDKKPYKATLYYENRIVNKSLNQGGMKLAEIRYKDDTIGYGADVSIMKNTTNFEEIRYYKDGKYIVNEKIYDRSTKDAHGEPIGYREGITFDRRTGEKYKSRRYPSGRVDILRKGYWSGFRDFIIEHTDNKGETTGYTEREYTKRIRGHAYHSYNGYCKGDYTHYYTQTDFDKDYKPIRMRNGMETEFGKIYV